MDGDTCHRHNTIAYDEYLDVCGLSYSSTRNNFWQIPVSLTCKFLRSLGHSLSFCYLLYIFSLCLLISPCFVLYLFCVSLYVFGEGVNIHIHIKDISSGMSLFDNPSSAMLRETYI